MVTLFVIVFKSKRLSTTSSFAIFLSNTDFKYTHTHKEGAQSCKQRPCSCREEPVIFVRIPVCPVQLWCLWTRHVKRWNRQTATGGQQWPRGEAAAEEEEEEQEGWQRDRLKAKKKQPVFNSYRRGSLQQGARWPTPEEEPFYGGQDEGEEEEGQSSDMLAQQNPPLEKHR